MRFCASAPFAARRTEQHRAKPSQAPSGQQRAIGTDRNSIAKMPWRRGRGVRAAASRKRLGTALVARGAECPKPTKNATKKAAHSRPTPVQAGRLIIGTGRRRLQMHRGPKACPWVEEQQLDVAAQRRSSTSGGAARLSDARPRGGAVRGAGWTSLAAQGVPAPQDATTRRPRKACHSRRDARCRRCTRRCGRYTRRYGCARQSRPVGATRTPPHQMACRGPADGLRSEDSVPAEEGEGPVPGVCPTLC